jgi:YHS domain-containing protein
MPELAEVPLPLEQVRDQTSLPPLMTEPQSTATAMKSLPETGKTSAPAAELAGEFPNPFPEVNETEADSKIVKLPKSSGTALDVPAAVNETKSVELNSPPETAAKMDEDPFAVKAKDFSEPSIDEKLAPGALTVVPPSTQSQVPQLTPPALETPSSELPRLESPPASATMPEISMPQPFEPPSKDNANPSSELMPPVTPPVMPTVTPPSSGPGAISPPNSAVDPQVEKMRRIRERFGMKGLKGFCPVTLHDERELVDARPEFHFTHRSQKFHFASTEAREKFEANPSKYAPAAYGADVVALCRDKDVVEGTLDFAAWFKGRLYLFGTQANYEVFISAPTKYATLAEIE